MAIMHQALQVQLPLVLVQPHQQSVSQVAPILMLPRLRAQLQDLLMGIWV